MDPIEYYEDKLAFQVDAWDLSETLRDGERVVVLDVRSPEDYEAGHIPGALNMPHRSMNPEISEKSDFKKRYHDGPEYNEHETSAINLTNFGTQVNTAEYQQNSQGEMRR